VLTEAFPHKFAKATPAVIKASHVCPEMTVPIHMLCGNFEIQTNDQ